MLHREQVVAGGDARAAIHHRLARRAIPEHALEVRLQLPGGTHRALVADVAAVRAIACARDVAVDVVERIGLALVALLRPCIDEQHGSIVEMRHHLVHREPHLPPKARREESGQARLSRGTERAAFARPLREAAVEHGDRIVSEIPQHPPQPARERARILVVRDDLRLVSNAETGERRRHRIERGERMAPVGAGTRPGEVVREVDEHGARNVARAILRGAPVLILQVVAAVCDEPRRIVEMCGEQFGRDEGGMHGVGIAPDRRGDLI